MGWAPMVMGGLQIAKGVVGAAGAMQSGNASATNYMVQAQIAMNNAAIAREQAEQEARVGEYRVAQQGLIGAAKMGALTAAQAKGGVDVNSGSNLAVRAAATRATVQDTKTVESDMAHKVYGYQVQASNFDNQAMMNARGASAAREAGRISAFSSLLDGAIGAGGNFGKFFFPGGGGGGAGAADPATGFA